MLDVVTEHDSPCMFAMLPYGEPWRRKSGIGKRAQRYRSHAGPTFDDICHRRTACWAEAVGREVTAVRDARPRPQFATNRYFLVRPPRLGCENTSAPFLTSEAMTNRNPHGLAFAPGTKLAAAARRCANGHRFITSKFDRSQLCRVARLGQRVAQACDVRFQSLTAERKEGQGGSCHFESWRADRTSHPYLRCNAFRSQWLSSPVTDIFKSTLMTHHVRLTMRAVRRRR